MEEFSIIGLDITVGVKTYTVKDIKYSPTHKMVYVYLWNGENEVRYRYEVFSEILKTIKS